MANTRTQESSYRPNYKLFILFLALITCGILLYQHTFPLYQQETSSVPCWLSGGTECENDIQRTLRTDISKTDQENKTLQQLHTINQLNSRVNYLEDTLNDLLHKEDTALDLNDWKKAINIDFDQSLSGVKTNVSEFQRMVSRLQEQVELMESRLNATNAESMEAGKEVKRKAPKKQILLFTYMRSGSTFVGELFKKNPDIAYWFEPLDGVYKHMYFSVIGGVYPVDVTFYTNGTRRKIPEFEHEILSNSLNALLGCDYKQLVPETLFHGRGLEDGSIWKNPQYTGCLSTGLKEAGVQVANARQAMSHCQDKNKQRCVIEKFDKCHKFKEAFDENPNDQKLPLLAQAAGITKVIEMEQRIDCMSRLDSVCQSCASHIESQCEQRTATATKVIRLAMETVEYMLKKNPDLKVIHLLRDPRGIVHSRSKIGLLSRLSRPRPVSKMVTEAELLCKKMETDIATRDRLATMYPDNFIEILYEDVASNQQSNYERIYKFLDLDLSPDVQKWIDSNNGETKKVVHESAFGTARSNSTATAYKWKEDVDDRTLEHLNSVCHNILTYLDVL